MLRRLWQLITSSKPVTTAPSSEEIARDELEHESTIALCSRVLRTGYPEADERSVSMAYDSCREKLRHYSDATLNRVILAAGIDIGEGLMKIMNYGSPYEEFVNDYITFAPFANDHDMNEMSQTLLALSHYDHLAPQSDPERRYQQVTALLRITTRHLGNKENSLISYGGVGGYKNRRTYIADEELRNLITLHDDPNFVADLMIDRHIYEAASLSAMLETMSNGTQTLSIGAL